MNHRQFKSECTIAATSQVRCLSVPKGWICPYLLLSGSANSRSAASTKWLGGEGKPWSSVGPAASVKLVMSSNWRASCNSAIFLTTAACSLAFFHAILSTCSFIKASSAAFCTEVHHFCLASRTGAAGWIFAFMHLGCSMEMGVEVWTFYYWWRGRFKASKFGCVWNLWQSACDSAIICPMGILYRMCANNTQ